MSRAAHSTLQGSPPTIRLPQIWRDALALFAVAMVVRAGTAWLVRHPGYMDAYYYFHVAKSVLSGRGLVEDTAWNYLTQPLALPRPSNAYWPPGASLFTAAGALPLAAGGDLSWRWAQVTPILGSAILVPATYILVRRQYRHRGERRVALTAAGLALFSGAYFPYWVTTDTFTPFALAGGTALWCAAEAGGAASRRGLLFAAGSAAGLAQCIRPDGVLLLAAPVVAALVPPANSHRDAGTSVSGVAVGRPRAPATVVATLAIIGAGFVLGALPWVVRNWLTWGRPTPREFAAALWLTEYDDLFRFAERPTFERWLDSGPGALVLARLQGLSGNAAVFGQPLLYYLLPAFALGVWRLRAERRLWPAAAYLACLYAAMSLVFPFQSVRGGFFHALAAALPFVYLATVVGVAAAVAAAAAWRRWNVTQAQRVFAATLVAFGALSSAYFAVTLPARWDAHLARYRAVAAWMDSRGGAPHRVMVADPPGFWYASGRSAIVIPSDGITALIAAAETFDAGLLLVEPTAPGYLAGIYDGSEATPDLEYVTTIGDMRLYRIVPQGPQVARVAPAS